MTLTQVSFTLLGSASTLSLQAQKSIHQNLAEIVQLHEDILGELYKVVPNAEYTQNSTIHLPVVSRPKHLRWHSVDIAPSRAPIAKLTRKLRLSLDLDRPAEECPVGVSAGSKTAADVARVFSKFVSVLKVLQHTGILTIGVDEALLRVRRIWLAVPDHAPRCREYVEDDSSVAVLRERYGSTCKLARVCQWPRL